MFQNFRKEAYTVVKSQGEYGSFQLWEKESLTEFLVSSLLISR